MPLGLGDQHIASNIWQSLVAENPPFGTYVQANLTEISTARTYASNLCLHQDLNICDKVSQLDFEDDTKRALMKTPDKSQVMEINDPQH